ncbi:hypothetical protein JL475_30615 [Streptomyces sp. M2CJ-2]|uniref:hypothetical protein n=1 Tax=Streptomyces sp. M2CJ-2 TaxID=2803948 RepID=UPI0019265DCF|nr:hypothetical protein [Streptomyces sp. M2CJ-2]MBL3670253.1 hypothetical protein [Streptomyces sp. M2CJ-2]
MTDLSMSERVGDTALRPVEPSDLEVAISVAQQLLHSDQILSLQEALRLLLRALDTGPREVRHANGLTFTVIPADSYDARMARDVRELTMEDGSVWTVGTRGAGSTFAWRPADEPPAPRCPTPHHDEYRVRKAREELATPVDLSDGRAVARRAGRLEVALEQLLEMLAERGEGQ